MVDTDHTRRMSAAPVAAVASSQAQEQTILKNKRVFKYFLRSFENPSNPELFRENAIKFAKWLENPRGYYDKARPEVRIRHPSATPSSEPVPATDHEARNGMSAVVQARHRSLSNLTDNTNYSTQRHRDFREFGCSIPTGGSHAPPDEPTLCQAGSNHPQIPPSLRRTRPAKSVTLSGYCMRLGSIQSPRVGLLKKLFESANLPSEDITPPAGGSAQTPPKAS